MVNRSSSALPGTKHKVIGLVSGGKDSCFNLMHAVANGHELVAIATLTPPPSIDELDSHLYQSVGTSLLPLIAQSLGLPLFSHVIRGKAVERGAEYGSRERGGDGSGKDGDETEDLTALLNDVMAAHPEATALASGAILSNYQRLRIEHVCLRLGLTSISYLWQEKQLPLVDRMIASGLDAILVKVAGVGLGVPQVGKSLAQLRPLLSRLESQYGAHPAGEGGEYETITLSTPLFSHRINITRSEIVVTDPEPYTVAYLRVTEAELEPKNGWVRPTVSELRELLDLDDVETGEEALDEESRDILADMGTIEIEEDNIPSVEGLAINESNSFIRQVAFGKSGRWFAISVESKQTPDESVGDELAKCFDTIKARLSEENLSLPLQATHITLLLSSMSLFPAANATYTTYFGTSPPSRATVAVPLPEGQRVRIEVVGFDDSVKAPDVLGRSALHVQGLSYWAPANIGPYSQAVTVNSRLHVAGQIPLIPASLTLPTYPRAPISPYPHQTILALQHVRRILSVLRSPSSTGGGWNGWGESCVAWWSRYPGCGVEGAAVVRRAWDLWAKANGFEHSPLIIVEANELPRGALVEYQVNVHTGRPGYDSEPSSSQLIEDEDDEDEGLKPIFASGKLDGMYWETFQTSRSGQGARAAIFLSEALDSSIQSLAARVSELKSVLRRAVTIRAFHISSISPSVLQREGEATCWTEIPVQNITDRHGVSYPIVLDVLSS